MGVDPIKLSSKNKKKKYHVSATINLLLIPVYMQEKYFKILRSFIFSKIYKLAKHRPETFSYM